MLPIIKDFLDCFHYSTLYSITSPLLKTYCSQSEEDLEEEEHILGLDDLERRGGKQSAGPAGNTAKPELVLESNQDAAEWKLEVERVMPQLLPDKKRSEKAVSAECLYMTLTLKDMILSSRIL